MSTCTQTWMSLPSHPSLPPRPVAGPQTQAFQHITPYGCAYPDPNTYSSHYAQAYYPQTAPQPSGFTFSSPATDRTNKTKWTPVPLMSFRKHQVFISWLRVPRVPEIRRIT